MMKWTLKALLLIGAYVLAFALAGCGSEGHDHHDHGPDHGDEISAGCHHIASGSVMTLSADSDDVQQVSIHARYEMELRADPDTNEAFEGTVVYQSPGGLHYLLFTEAVSATLTDADGNVVQPSQTNTNGPIAGCDGANSLVIIPLPTGEYRIDIQTSMISKVEFTVHRAGDSHDHHDH